MLRVLERLRGGEEVKVVVFGGSVTYGYGVKKGYVDLFKEALSSRYPTSKITLINAGFPGDTARKGLLRLEKDVMVHEPDLIIVAFGVSDFRNGVNVGRFSSNLTSIVERIMDGTDSEILLLTPNPLDVPSSDYLMRPYRREIHRIGHRYRIGVVDIYVAFKRRTEKEPLSALLADKFHPNEAGHKIFVDELMRFF
jgi:lysophospholipase L1-like esterase